jgi:hypothetical protein
MTSLVSLPKSSPPKHCWRSSGPRRSRQTGVAMNARLRTPRHSRPSPGPSAARSSRPWPASAASARPAQHPHPNRHGTPLRGRPRAASPGPHAPAAGGAARSPSQRGCCVQDQLQARQGTQGKLADKCQLHRTFIGSVQRGERSLSILNLRLIVRVLRASLAGLLGRLTRWLQAAPPTGSAGVRRVSYALASRERPIATSMDRLFRARSHLLTRVRCLRWKNGSIQSRRSRSPKAS